MESPPRGCSDRRPSRGGCVGHPGIGAHKVVLDSDARRRPRTNNSGWEGPSGPEVHLRARKALSGPKGPLGPEGHSGPDGSSHRLGRLCTAVGGRPTILPLAQVFLVARARSLRVAIRDPLRSFLPPRFAENSRSAIPRDGVSAEDGGGPVLRAELAGGLRRGGRAGRGEPSRRP